MKKKLGIYFILTVAGLGVYINTLHHPFIWDDFLYVALNPHLRDPNFIQSYFTSSFCEGAPKPCDFFRPVVSLSYLMDFWIWGDRPFGFHLTNVLIHFGVVLLFYWVTDRLFQNSRAAFLSALLFAVHPIHTESIAFVAARTDPPAAVFFLLALYFFDRHLYFKRVPEKGAPFPKNRMGKNFLFLSFSLTAYLFGLLTKEIAVTIPLLLVVYDLVCVRPWKNILEFLNRWDSYIGFGIILFFYFWMRSEALGFGLTQDLKWNELWDRLWMVPGLFWDYFRINLVPYPLVLLHDTPKLFGSAGFVSIWGALFLMIYLFVLIRFRGGSRTILFGGLWFLIVFLPVLNIIPIPWPAVVERFSYIPTLGFSLAVGFLGDAVLRKSEKFSRPWVRKGTIGIIACILVIFSLLTVTRNQTWGDELSLWKDTVHKSPGNAYAQRNLGRLYHARGDFKQAVIAYEKSLETDDSMAVTYQILGALYQNMGLSDKALEKYQVLIRMDRAFPSTFFNMGLLFEGKEEYDRAASFYEKALRLDPDQHNAQARLNAIMHRMEDGSDQGKSTR